MYAHSDNDPAPRPTRCAGATRRGLPCVRARRVPLFTNSHDPRHGGLPLPEFTWVGWGAAEPWCVQQRQLTDAARAAPWAARDQRLFFSGGLDNGHHRKALRYGATARSLTPGPLAACRILGTPTLSQWLHGVIFHAP